MKIVISQSAQRDLEAGYWFYEKQRRGLGDYFRESLIDDIDRLAHFAGIHERAWGHHRTLSKRFPHSIYYDVDRVGGVVQIIAVIDARSDPDTIRRRFT